MTPYPEAIKVQDKYLVPSLDLPDTYYLFPQHGPGCIIVEARIRERGGKYIWSNLYIPWEMNVELRRLLIDASYKSATCTSCQIEKPISEFYDNRSKKNGKQSLCKECFLEMKRRNARRSKNLISGI